MSNTYSQIHLQMIFSPRYRESLIGKEWQEELHKYITGIVQNNNHKLIIINSMPDHVHLFIGMRPHQSVSALMQDVKGESSKWINQKKFVRKRFEWQQGYGVFSYSYSHIPRVIEYIRNQERHHRKKIFIDEYRSFLKAFQIEFDERYILKEPE